MRESKVIKRWEDKGRREQTVESILDVLQAKFGTVPADLLGQLKRISDLFILRPLFLGAVRARSLDDFRKQIPNGTK